MEAERIARLEGAGVDFQTGLNRFMKNEALYEKFLNKFPEDLCMEQIRTAFAEKNIEQAFRAAHTLTGVAGNLSFVHLHQKVSVMTEALRGGNFEQGFDCLPEVEEAYAQVMEALTSL